MEAEHSESSETHKVERSTHPCNFTKTPQPQNITTPPALPTTAANGLNSPHTALELVIREIELRKSGRFPVSFQPWLVFSLPPSDLEALDIHFKDDWYWVEKLSCDYFGSSQQFVLRMYSQAQEVLRGRVNTNLSCQLDTFPKLYRNEAARRLVEDLEASVSTTVYSAVGTPYSHNDPDISFKHLDADYPGVIIEIGYSQKAERLEKLANEYICGSSGQINVVIGVKMEYPQKKSKKATFSIWKPQWTSQDGKQSVRAACTAHEIIRNEDGSPNLAAELSFSLSEIAPRSMIDRLEMFDDHTLRISAKQLCVYLERADRG